MKAIVEVEINPITGHISYGAQIATTPTPGQVQRGLIGETVTDERDPENSSYSITKAAAYLEGIARHLLQTTQAYLASNEISSL